MNNVVEAKLQILFLFSDCQPANIETSLVASPPTSPDAFTPSPVPSSLGMGGRREWGVTQIFKITNGEKCTGWLCYYFNEFGKCWSDNGSMMSEMGNCVGLPCPSPITGTHQHIRSVAFNSPFQIMRKANFRQSIVVNVSFRLPIPPI